MGKPAAGVDPLVHLADLISAGGVCVLSGAGMSTASGIPDYRGPSRQERRSAPIQFHEFRDKAAARQRYWARSAVGWKWIQAREPNPAHHTVAKLERRGFVESVITQNVDGLHQRAGNQRVVELHGSLSQTICMVCGTVEPRRQFQARLLALNPGFAVAVAEVAPDGDAEVPEDLMDGFVVPTCARCGGVMKPDVVFFGESVPGERVRQAFDLVDEASLLLVLGSSLTVFSGFRFVKHASKRPIPIAIVTQGETRGDALADVKIEARLEELLPRLGLS